METRERKRRGFMKISVHNLQVSPFFAGDVRYFGNAWVELSGTFGKKAAWDETSDWSDKTNRTSETAKTKGTASTVERNNADISQLLCWNLCPYKEKDMPVIIFPEHDPPYNNILSTFQDRFVTVARQYYRRSGQTVSFVPLYIAPTMHTMYLGRPVAFDPSVPNREECRRVCDELTQRITDLATGLPLHRVVPYRNIPKTQYPYNLPLEVYSHDEADG